MHSSWELAHICSAFILNEDEVTVLENRIKVLSKAAGINVELLWPGLFAKTLDDANIRSPICNIGAGGPAPAAGAPARSATVTPAEGKREEAEKEGPEECCDDMGFDLLN